MFTLGTKKVFNAEVVILQMLSVEYKKKNTEPLFSKAMSKVGLLTIG